MEDIIGINSEQLQNIINELNVRLITISQIFEQMESTIHECNYYAKQGIGDSIRESFQEISVNFPTIKDNINTYIQELNACKENYARQDAEAAILFNDHVHD